MDTSGNECLCIFMYLNPISVDTKFWFYDKKYKMAALARVK